MLTFVGRTQNLKNELINKQTLERTAAEEELLNRQLARTEKVWDSLSSLLKQKYLAQNYKDSIKVLFKQNKVEQEKIYKNFIGQNTNSLVSVKSLNGFKSKWGKDVVVDLFKKLTPSVQETQEGKSVKKFLLFFHEPEVGEKYTDFF